MKEILQKQLETNENYSQEQLTWLIEHISDENPQIRDELVYASFCHAILDALLTPEDYHWLLQQLWEHGSVTSPHTPTRSFTALVLALFLYVDSLEGSPYENRLTTTDKVQLFQAALQFLSNETDSRGWDEQLDWLHAIAHGSDFLLTAACHPDFPKEDLDKVWQSVLSVFQKQTKTFSAGEDQRLANVIVQLILSEKLSPEELIDFLKTTTLPNQEPQDYFAYLNFQHFFQKIYLDLDKENQLSENLKLAIQECLIN